MDYFDIMRIDVLGAGNAVVDAGLRYISDLFWGYQGLKDVWRFLYNGQWAVMHSVRS